MAAVDNAAASSTVRRRRTTPSCSTSSGAIRARAAVLLALIASGPAAHGGAPQARCGVRRCKPSRVSSENGGVLDGGARHADLGPVGHGALATSSPCSTTRTTREPGSRPSAPTCRWPWHRRAPPRRAARHAAPGRRRPRRRRCTSPWPHRGRRASSERRGGAGRGRAPGVARQRPAAGRCHRPTRQGPPASAQPSSRGTTDPRPGEHRDPLQRRVGRAVVVQDVSPHVRPRAGGKHDGAMAGAGLGDGRDEQGVTEEKGVVDVERRGLPLLGLSTTAGGSAARRSPTPGGPACRGTGGGGTGTGSTPRSRSGWARRSTTAREGGHHGPSGCGSRACRRSSATTAGTARRRGRR